MPVTTPSIKVDAVRRLGSRIVLHGDSYDEASAHGAREKHGYRTFIHPYDDPAW
jgi:threonine dehydratase